MVRCATLRGIVDQVVGRLLQPTGYRFYTQGNASYLTFSYHCCQDNDHKSHMKPTIGKRDGDGTERFNSNSLRVSIDFGLLTISPLFQHRYYHQFVNNGLSLEISQFTDRVLSHTPAEIYQEITSQELPGAQDAAEYQI